MASLSCRLKAGDIVAWSWRCVDDPVVIDWIDESTGKYRYTYINTNISYTASFDDFLDRAVLLTPLMLELS